ncbi:hypothetical protein B0H10DRAFT_2224310 [Mycena sp. CBHHK59/15]|nr:hypothetical protein B0H10DRAFT_2224310 [Mycena sp. CBHHK59/15]
MSAVYQVFTRSHLSNSDQVTLVSVSCMYIHLVNLDGYGSGSGYETVNPDPNPENPDPNLENPDPNPRVYGLSTGRWN